MRRSRKMSMKIAAKLMGLDLVTVKPSNISPVNIGYIEFRYSTIRDIRKLKLNKLLRNEKIKYIDEILKNN